MDVVDTIRVRAFRYLRYKVGNFFGLEGVLGVEHPDSRVEECTKYQVFVDAHGRLAGLVLINVMGAVTAWPVEEVFGVGHGQSAGDDWVGLHPVIHQPDQFGVILTTLPDGLLCDYQHLAFEQWQHRVGEAWERRRVVDVS